MSKIFYDIMPPKKIMERRKRRVEKTFPEQSMARAPIAFLCLFLILSLNWAGLLAVGETVAYLIDEETSFGNTFVAGDLDFILDSPPDFSPHALLAGESATREIDVLNNASNLFKYIVTAKDFSSPLCNYLTLEANVAGGDPAEYIGPLMAFVFGPTNFGDPTDWSFKLTLDPNTPESLQGEVCQFKFIFDGSQTKNDLPFGQGFNDIEEISNTVAMKVCIDSETRSKGYWKNHEEAYSPSLLPQTLGKIGGDDTIDTVAKVTQVLQTDYSNSMRAKLRGQLLAMKFNVAKFGIGDYIHEGETRTINQIIIDADNLLRQDPAPADSVLETTKDLLDHLNNLHLISSCAPPVEPPDDGCLLSMLETSVEGEILAAASGLEGAERMSVWDPEATLEDENPLAEEEITSVEENNEDGEAMSLPPEGGEAVISGGSGGGGASAPEDNIIIENSNSEPSVETPAEAENPPAETEVLPPAENENITGTETTENPIDNSTPVDTSTGDSQLTSDVATPEVVSDVPDNSQSSPGDGPGTGGTPDSGTAPSSDSGAAAPSSDAGVGA